MYPITAWRIVDNVFRLNSKQGFSRIQQFLDPKIPIESLELFVGEARKKSA
jgi:hypothetical protein